MTERSDIELLREYSHMGAETAFSEVVSRHLGMVYHAALRQVRIPEVAEEVAQTVFALLARKAGNLATGTVVPGWLFKTTRFVAARAARDDYRRRRREEEAARMNLNSRNEESDQIEQALPILDEMMSRLREEDRDALLVRYFEAKSFAQLAHVLGASEAAARKRVQRALERLRQLLATRGIALGTGALASGLEATGVQAAPAGLATLVSSAALQQATGVTAISLLIQTTLKAMTLSKIKIIGTAAVALAVAGGTVAYVSLSKPELMATVAAGEMNNSRRDNGEIARLEAENTRLAGVLAQTASENQRLQAARQEAQQSADKYRELAEKVKAENPTPLESYPTPRHALVGFGKLTLLTLSAKKFSQLPPEEKTGAEAEKVKADMMQRMQDTVRLIQAISELKMDQVWQEKARTPEEDADQFTCFLHGVLDLNQQQFTQIETALKNHYQIPGVERAVIPVAGPGPGKMPRSPFQSLDPNTLQQIQSSLTQRQRETLEQVITPQSF